MLGKIHFYLGIILVITFILTGQYMHHKFDHLADMESTKRALFRAGHIYILLFGLINLSLGSYFKLSTHSFKNKLQLLSSGLILVSSIGIVYSFFTELPAVRIERMVSRYCLYFVMAGVIGHGLGYWIKNDE